MASWCIERPRTTHSYNNNFHENLKRDGVTTCNRIIINKTNILKEKIHQNRILFVNGPFQQDSSFVRE